MPHDKLRGCFRDDSISDEKWQRSYDAWKTDPGPMPSVGQSTQAEREFQRDCYAASFEQDVLQAVQRLGWARVNLILDKCRED